MALNVQTALTLQTAVTPMHQSFPQKQNITNVSAFVFLLRGHLTGVANML